MPLVEVELAMDSFDVPGDVDAFLREADSRIDQFVKNRPSRLCGFAPSDFVTVYRALRAISEANLAAGNLFCEWGSGFGVAASLAAILEFDSSGIETEMDLVAASQKLADDHGLRVQFVHGSFVPPGGDVDAERIYAADRGDFFWLVTDTDNAYDELGLEPDDFDLVFAYPWPNEGRVIEALFEKYAAEGALLLTYNELDSVHLKRKKRRRRRRDR